jgi:DNA-binding transcriptional LysR family regulator
MTAVAAGDMDGLLVLALVAERGSFSAAARELGVAPSAVSKRIATLEARLDARLFLRTTRRVTLSQEGAKIHAHAESVLGAWRALNHTGAEKGGSVRINAPGLFVETVLVPFLATYRARRPDVWCVASSEDAMIELASDAFDVVIRVSREITRASAVVRRVGRDRLVTVASPAYLEQFGTPRRPADLAMHRALRYTPRKASDEWRFSIEGRPVSTRVPSVFEADEDAALRAAALAGMGLGVMPRMFVAPDLAAGRLVSVLEAEMWAPDRHVHAILVEGRMAPSRVRELIEALALYMRRMP